MRVIDASETGILVLGYQGESQRVMVRLPLVDERNGRNVAEEFPGGQFSLSVTFPNRPGEFIVSPSDYQVTGNWIEWEVKAAYTQFFGEGNLQINYSGFDSTGMVKSKVWRITNKKSISTGAGTVPDWSDWKTELLSAAADVQSAVESYDAMTASAEGLPAGSTPTAVIDRSGENPVLRLGIPAGQSGGVTVDSELSNTSTNPVQNKVIAGALSSQSETIVELAGTVSGKYSKPQTGIPSTDMSQAVQTSLGKADTALQAHQDISGKQNKPSVAGTAGQVLGLDSSLNPVWITPSGGGGGTDTDVIAEAYSPAKTYSVGSFCIQNDKLYKCMIPILSAEAFDSSHWLEVKTADEIFAFDKNLDDYSGYKNYSIFAGHYINTNGETVNIKSFGNGSGWGVVVVPCSPGDVFHYVGVAGSSPRCWCFINAADPESATNLSNSGESSGSVIDVYITAPANTTHLVCNFDMEYSHSLKSGRTVDETVAPIIREALNNKASIILGSEKTGASFYILPEIVDRMYNSSTPPSMIYEDSGMHYWQLDAAQGEILEFVFNDTKAYTSHYYNEYDSNGNLLVSALLEDESKELTRIVASANTAYIKISQWINNGENATMTVTGHFPGEGSSWSGKKVVTFGDSITWYDGHTFPSDHSEYGQVCVGYQSYMRQKLECIVDNEGAAGAWMGSILPYIKATTFTNYDAATITFGANDFRYPSSYPVGEIAPIGSTFDESTIFGALQSGIEYILNHKPTIKIFLITPIKGWNDGNRMPETYPNIIKSVGELYSLPVLDLYHRSGINELTKATLIGDDEAELDYALHPTNAGFKRMGDLIVAFFNEN